MIVHPIISVSLSVAVLANPQVTVPRVEFLEAGFRKSHGAASRLLWPILWFNLPVEEKDLLADCDLSSLRGVKALGKRCWKVFTL